MVVTNSPAPASADAPPLMTATRPSKTASCIRDLLTRTTNRVPRSDASPPEVCTRNFSPGRGATVNSARPTNQTSRSSLRSSVRSRLSGPRMTRVLSRRVTVRDSEAVPICSPPKVGCRSGRAQYCRAANPRATVAAERLATAQVAGRRRPIGSADPGSDAARPMNVSTGGGAGTSKAASPAASVMRMSSSSR